MSGQLKEDAPQSGAPATHPLFQKEIRPIRDWDEWLSRWEAAATVEEMLGLLHTGFDVSLRRHAYGKTDHSTVNRLAFYFSVADGWSDKNLLETQEEKKGRHKYTGGEKKEPPFEYRHTLARKAFDVLCLHFFKTATFPVVTHDDYNEWRWWERMLISENLLSVIRHFFRPEAARYADRIEIRNLPYPDFEGKFSHNEKHALAFLENLAKFIWKWERPGVPSYLDEQKQDEINDRLAACDARIQAAKPWMVEVLANMGKLDVLRKWILELEKPCIEKLREIAFRTELSEYQHPVEKSRKVETVEEACYVGSQAAWFLKKIEITQDVQARFEELREIKREKEKAEEKARRLNSRIKKLSAKK